MKLSAWCSVPKLLPRTRNYAEKWIFERFGRTQKMTFKLHDISHIFKTLKKSGVHGMELLVPKHTTDQNLKEIEKIIEKNNFPVHSVHQSLLSFIHIGVSEIERLFSIAKMFEAQVVVLHAGALRRRIFNENFLAVIKNLEKTYKVKVGIENLPKSPFSLHMPFTWSQKRFSSAVQKTGLNVTLDTTHLAQAGGDIVEFYKQNKERIINIHLSDFKKTWRNTKFMLTKDTHLPLGKGELPINEFLKALKKYDYNGLITMEIDGTLEDLCKSAETIKNFTDNKKLGNQDRLRREGLDAQKHLQLF